MMIDNKLIRDLRQKRNMTLQELARRADLSVSYLSEIELGKKQPSLETVDKLSHALNISREGLITTNSSGAAGLGQRTSPTGEKPSFRTVRKSRFRQLFCQTETYACFVRWKNIARALIKT